MGSVEQILTHIDNVDKVASMFEQQGKDYKSAGKSMSHIIACLETFLPLDHPSLEVTEEYRVITQEILGIIKQSLMKGYRSGTGEECHVKFKHVTTCCWRKRNNDSDDNTPYQMTNK